MWLCRFSALPFLGGNQGASRVVFLSSENDSGCWQSSLRWGCRTEVPSPRRPSAEPYSLAHSPYRASHGRPGPSHTVNLSSFPFARSPQGISSTQSLCLTLSLSLAAFNGSCDYVGSTQIIQNNLHFKASWFLTTIPSAKSLPSSTCMHLQLNAGRGTLAGHCLPEPCHLHCFCQPHGCLRRKVEWKGRQFIYYIICFTLQKLQLNPKMNPK